MSDFVLRAFGHVLFFLLFVGVPPFIVGFVKELRQGDKAVGIPFSVADWLALLALYAIAAYLYIFHWLLAD